MHFDKRGGGGGGGGGGFVRFLGAVVRNGVLYKNSDQLWLFYCN